MTTLARLRSFSSGRRCARAHEHPRNSRTTQYNCTPDSEGLDVTRTSRLPVHGREMSLDISFHRTHYFPIPGLLAITRFIASYQQQRESLPELRGPLRPNTPFASRTLKLAAISLQKLFADLSLSQFLPEELHDHVIGLPRLGDVRVVEEAVKHAFPHMQIGVDSGFDQLCVGMHGRAHLKATRASNNQRGWKLLQHLRRVDWRNQRIVRIGPLEVAEARTAADAHI